MATPRRFSCGVVVVRRAQDDWHYLLLRAFGRWDFPKGTVEPGEAPLAAAMRECEEETGITELTFEWGEVWRETALYNYGKVARYYLASTTQDIAALPVSPELGHPEHDAWRWVRYGAALQLVTPRLRPVVAWAEGVIRARGDTP